LNSSVHPVHSPDFGPLSSVYACKCARVHAHPHPNPSPRQLIRANHHRTTAGRACTHGCALLGVQPKRISLLNWRGTASVRVKRNGLSPLCRTLPSAPIKGKCSGNGASDGLGIRAYGSKDGLTISTRLSASRDRIYWTFWHGASGGYARESWHPATPSSWRPWCRSWSMPCLPRPRRTTRFPRKVLLVLKQS
jgi:hypothetical protein